MQKGKSGVLLIQTGKARVARGWGRVQGYLALYLALFSPSTLYPKFLAQVARGWRRVGRTFDRVFWWVEPLIQKGKSIPPAVARGWGWVQGHLGRGWRRVGRELDRVFWWARADDPPGPK